MFIRLSVLGSSLLLLSACAPMIDVHGDTVDPDVLASFTPGTTSYLEVQKALGSPSSKTVFDGENWIYLRSEQERIAFLKPKEISREITVLKFNENGVLQSVEKKTLEQGRNIEPSAEKTRSDQNTLTILDQMISNVGRMNTDAPVH